MSLIKSCFNVIYIYKGGLRETGSISNSFYTISIATGEQSILNGANSIPMQRYGHVMVWDPTSNYNTIYVFGGCDGSSVLNDV